MTSVPTPKKMLHVRERELQILHSTPLGLVELQSIAAEYGRASGKPLAAGDSIITYILVYERDRELIFVN